MRDFSLTTQNVLILSVLIAASVTVIAPPAAAADTDTIGFVETFALAEDRAKALEQLIPGTEDYYFYHALHYQNTGQAEKLQRYPREVAASG